jgi:hypothetical protein
MRRNQMRSDAGDAANFTQGNMDRRQRRIVESRPCGRSSMLIAETSSGTR